MKEESWFYRLLKWFGFIKASVVNKEEMCERAKSVCNRHCETCIWHE